MKMQDIFGYSLSIGSAGHNVVTKNQGYFADEDTAARLADDTQYTLIYVSRGSQVFDPVSGKKLSLSEGDFMFFRVNKAPTRYNTSNTTIENYYVNFQCCDIHLLETFDFQLNRIYHADPTTMIIAKFEALIADHIASAFPLSVLASAAHMIDLLVTLHRTVFHRNKTRPRLSSDAVTKVAISMYTDSELNLSLEEYADMCGLSKYHFCREFKKNYGISPIAFRNRTRVNNACSYLENTNMSVSKIASIVGFSRLSLFVNAFRTVYDMTPTQYRAQLHAKEKNENLT